MTNSTIGVFEQTALNAAQQKNLTFSIADFRSDPAKAPKFKKRGNPEGLKLRDAHRNNFVRNKEKWDRCRTWLKYGLTRVDSFNDVIFDLSLYFYAGDPEEGIDPLWDDNESRASNILNLFKRSFPDMLLDELENVWNKIVAKVTWRKNKPKGTNPRWKKKYTPTGAGMNDANKAKQAEARQRIDKTVEELTIKLGKVPSIKAIVADAKTNHRTIKKYANELQQRQQAKLNALTAKLDEIQKPVMDQIQSCIDSMSQSPLKKIHEANATPEDFAAYGNFDPIAPVPVVTQLRVTPERKNDPAYDPMFDNAIVYNTETQISVSPVEKLVENPTKPVEIGGCEEPKPLPAQVLEPVHTPEVPVVYSSVIQSLVVHNVLKSKKRVNKLLTTLKNSVCNASKLNKDKALPKPIPANKVENDQKDQNLENQAEPARRVILFSTPEEKDPNTGKWIRTKNSEENPVFYPNLPGMLDRKVGVGLFGAWVSAPVMSALPQRVPLKLTNGEDHHIGYWDAELDMQWQQLPIAQENLILFEHKIDKADLDFKIAGMTDLIRNFMRRDPSNPYRPIRL